MVLGWMHIWCFAMQNMRQRKSPKSDRKPRKSNLEWHRLPRIFHVNLQCCSARVNSPFCPPVLSLLCTGVVSPCWSHVSMNTQFQWEKKLRKSQNSNKCLICFPNPRPHFVDHEEPSNPEYIDTWEENPVDLIVLLVINSIVLISCCHEFPKLNLKSSTESSQQWFLWIILSDLISWHLGCPVTALCELLNELSRLDNHLAPKTCLPTVLSSRGDVRLGAEPFLTKVLLSILLRQENLGGCVFLHVLTTAEFFSTTYQFRQFQTHLPCLPICLFCVVACPLTSLVACGKSLSHRKGLPLILLISSSEDLCKKVTKARIYERQTSEET